MWVFLILLGLPSLGSGTPLTALRLPAPPKNGSGPEPRGASTSPAPPETPTTLSPRSEAPALSLNLGLNFKIKVRSQGKAPPGEGSRGATADPGLPPTQAPGSRLWAEALGGSGWGGLGLAEELPSGPGGWAWEGSPGGPAEPHLPASSPTPQLPLTRWPRLSRKGLVAPTTGDDSRELEFKIDIDLTAGLGKEAGLAPNGSGPGRHLPLLPGLRVGIAEIASKLREAPGLLGSRIPPVTWEPPDWNATGSIWEPPGDPALTPEGALVPGAEEPSSAPAASPGSGGALAALPGGCGPDGAEECGSPLPAPGGPALSSLLAPGLPLPVALQSDWRGAREAWGAAWEAQVYGAGALFALLALLALLALAALPCRCPPGARLLAPLQLLLAGAGAARALPLLLAGRGEACGLAGPWPPLAAGLLHELPLPCLTSALALGGLLLLLLARRGPGTGPPAAWLLAPLLGLHFAAAAGAVLAAERLPRAAPFLLLAARGLFALLAALLSATLLAAACLARRAPPKEATACPQPPPPAARRRAAAAALPAALCGLLAAALHAYGLLHALGYGLSADLFVPWPWWALQLAGRLCEAGVGLPLCALGLCALGAASPAAPAPSAPCCPPCCRACLSAERVAAKAQQSLPRHFPWALAQPDKPALAAEGGGGGGGGPADYLPLCALPPDGAPSLLSFALDDAADPTADFRPPSPIDLRRSIDEALCCSQGLFPGGGGRPGGALSAASTLSLRPPARPTASDSHLFRTASCVELLAVQPSPHSARSEPRTADPASPDASDDASSPAPRIAASLLPGARSPPPPGRRQYWAPALPPASQESLASLARPRGGEGGAGAEAAVLQEEFLDVCRQIDALSVSSETIDL